MTQFPKCLLFFDFCNLDISYRFEFRISDFQIRIPQSAIRIALLSAGCLDGLNDLEITRATA